MELILWRHAEAQDPVAGLPDSKRRLTPRGEKQAQLVARWFDAQRPKHLKVLVSPAIRCQQTAHALALPCTTDPRIGPGADVDDLLTAAGWRENDEHGEGVTLLVGHQPVLGRLAAWLMTGQETDWTIRKGALWWFSRRVREDRAPILLRAVVDPGMLQKSRGAL